MVIDSTNDEYKHMLVNAFTSRLIRFYYGTDIIGNEIGAASKNVIGIAAGMLDGFGMSALKGALMARGTREIARLISVGGQAMSAYGLATSATTRRQCSRPTAITGVLERLLSVVRSLTAVLQKGITQQRPWFNFRRNMELSFRFAPLYTISFIKAQIPWKARPSL